MRKRTVLGVLGVLAWMGLGAAISDEAFQLPTGIQVMDMGAMMGMQ